MTREEQIKKYAKELGADELRIANSGKMYG